MIPLLHRTCALALLGLAALGAAEPVLVADTASGSVGARAAGQLTLIEEFTGLPLPPGPPSGQLAFHGGFLGQLDLDGSGAPTKPLALSIRLPSGSLVAGGTAILVAVGGIPPLRITASGSQVLTTQVPGSVDLDGDSEPDIGALGLLTVGAAGPLTALVTDALGATVSLPLTAAALLAPVGVAAPTVAVSTGTDTVYGAFCPSTAHGVQSVLTWAAGHDVRSGRAFAWDAQAQGFTALPTQPAGGLAADQGVFLAAREPVQLDLSGNPGPLAHAWLLLPGWNLIGIPALVDGEGSPVATHDRAADFTLQDETGADIETGLAATLASSAYAWDGSAYQTAATLRSGQAYWIANNTDSPGRPLFLVRSGSSPQPALRAKSVAANGYRTRDRGEPPPPPGTAAQQSADGGGCGAGGGIALVGTLLLGLAFRRRR